MSTSPEIEHLQKAAIIASRLIKHQTPLTTQDQESEAEANEFHPEAQ